MPRHGQDRTNATMLYIKAPEVNEDAVVIRLSVVEPDNIPHPARQLRLTKTDSTIQIGRASTRVSQNLNAAVDNGWFDSAVMSRDHAKINVDFDTKRVYIRDDQSMHGTYLNQGRILSDAPQRLKIGDTLVLGLPVFRSDKTHAPLKIEIEHIEFVAPSTPLQSPARVFTVPDDYSTDDNGEEESAEDDEPLEQEIIEHLDLDPPNNLAPVPSNGIPAVENRPIPQMDGSFDHEMDFDGGIISDDSSYSSDAEYGNSDNSSDEAGSLGVFQARSVESPLDFDDESIHLTESETSSIDQDYNPDSNLDSPTWNRFSDSEQEAVDADVDDDMDLIAPRENHDCDLERREDNRSGGINIRPSTPTPYDTHRIGADARGESDGQDEPQDPPREAGPQQLVQDRLSCAPRLPSLTSVFCATSQSNDLWRLPFDPTQDDVDPARVFQNGSSLSDVAVTKKTMNAEFREARQHNKMTIARLTEQGTRPSCPALPEMEDVFAAPLNPLAAPRQEGYHSGDAIPGSALPMASSRLEPPLHYSTDSSPTSPFRFYREIAGDRQSTESPYPRGPGGPGFTGQVPAETTPCPTVDLALPRTKEVETSKRKSTQISGATEADLAWSREEESVVKMLGADKPRPAASSKSQDVPDVGSGSAPRTSALPSPPPSPEETGRVERPSKKMRVIAERVGYAALGGATVGAMVLTSLIYTAPSFV